MDKAVQRIIDGTVRQHDYRRPSKPAAPIAELRRRPDDHMKWHLKHRPYEKSGREKEEQV